MDAPVEAVDHVIAALFTLVAADTGMCDDILGPADCGAAGEPSTAAWYGFVSGNVEVVRYDPCTDAIARASDGYTRTVKLCDIFSAEPAPYAEPYSLASTFVHEAKHLSGDFPHLSNEACRYFDGSRDSAFGAQASWLAAWGGNGELSAGMAAAWDDRLEGVCDRIFDTTGFYPCAGRGDGERCDDGVAEHD